MPSHIGVIAAAFEDDVVVATDLTVVQRKSASESGSFSDTLAVTFTSAVTNGNSIVVAYGADALLSSATGVGGSFAIVGQDSLGAGNVGFAYASEASGGSTTVTLHFASQMYNRFATVYEVEGPIAAVVGSYGTFDNTPTAVTAVPSPSNSDGALFVSAFAMTAPISAGPTNSYTGDISTDTYWAAAYLLATDGLAHSTTYTIGLNQGGCSAQVAFEATASTGGGGSPPPDGEDGYGANSLALWGGLSVVASGNNGTNLSNITDTTMTQLYNKGVRTLVLMANDHIKDNWASSSYELRRMIEYGNVDGTTSGLGNMVTRWHSKGSDAKILLGFYLVDRTLSADDFMLMASPGNSGARSTYAGYWGVMATWAASAGFDGLALDNENYPLNGGGVSTWGWGYNGSAGQTADRSNVRTLGAAMATQILAASWANPPIVVHYQASGAVIPRGWNADMVQPIVNGANPDDFLGYVYIDWLDGLWSVNGWGPQTICEALEYRGSQVGNMQAALQYANGHQAAWLSTYLTSYQTIAPNLMLGSAIWPDASVTGEYGGVAMTTGAVATHLGYIHQWTSPSSQLMLYNHRANTGSPNDLIVIGTGKDTFNTQFQAFNVHEVVDSTGITITPTTSNTGTVSHPEQIVRVEVLDSGGNVLGYAALTWSAGGGAYNTNYNGSVTTYNKASVPGTHAFIRAVTTLEQTITVAAT